MSTASGNPQPAPSLPVMFFKMVIQPEMNIWGCPSWKSWKTRKQEAVDLKREGNERKEDNDKLLDKGDKDGQWQCVESCLWPYLKLDSTAHKGPEKRCQISYTIPLQESWREKKKESMECKQWVLWCHWRDFRSICLLLFLDKGLRAQLDKRAGASRRNQNDISLFLMWRVKVELWVSNVPHFSEHMVGGSLLSAESDILPKNWELV